MSYQVKTRVFEGPLDLLLQLITSHQLDITDLSLGSLVSEYLEHLDAMRQMDIEVTSEFLLIAATLIQLKARTLLPGDVDIDLACLTFKDVAAVLGHRMQGNVRYVPRLAGLDADITPAPPEFRLGISPPELALLATRVFNRLPAEPELDHLELDLPSVEDAIADLRRRMDGEAVAEFDALVDHCQRPMEVIAYFLALLELSRWGVLSVQQDLADGPITVAHSIDGPELDLLETEWS